MSIGNHGLEVGRDYELTIGSSFQSGRARDAYHLMRYDFKPASIDTNRPAHFEVGENKQCSVTIPNIQDSSSSATTSYKGGKKPCTKECVLIIDKQTGQITLERITSTIPLKKCRNDKQSMVPKAHSEMENMEVMEKSMNLKKMFKDKRQPAKGDKSEKKGGSSSGNSGTSGKQNKDAPPGTTTMSQGSASKSLSKQSSSSHPPPPPPPPPPPTPPNNTSSLNNPSQQTQQQPPPPTPGALNASNGNSNGATKNTPTNVPPRQRLMSSSDMSVSSGSSDSSDSDSSDEGGDAQTPSKSAKPANPPPPPPPKTERSPSKSNHETQQQQQQQQQQRQPSFPPKTDPSPAKQPPPAPKVEHSPAKPLPKEATVKGKEKAFLSTLQSDLQLSDSDGSDSD